MIQLHAERSPTLLDLSPQANSMPTQHGGSAGFAEYLDKMLGRGVFSKPLQNILPDVSHQPTTYAARNDELSQYEVDLYGNKGGGEKQLSPNADKTHERTGVASQQPSRQEYVSSQQEPEKQDLMAKQEAAQKQHAAKQAATEDERSRSKEASRLDSKEATRAEEDASGKDAVSSGADETDQNEASLKAAAAVSAAVNSKGDSDQNVTKEAHVTAAGKKAVAVSKSSGENADHGDLKLGQENVGEKTEQSLEEKVVDGASGVEADKGELSGKQHRAAANDSPNDAGRLNAHKAFLGQAKEASAESSMAQATQSSDDAKSEKLSALKSESRSEVASAGSQQSDEKAERVVAASAASIAGEKSDGENGRTRSRVRTELVVDLSKYETAAESDKTGTRQSGGESRGGDQDGRNAFGARLDGFGGTDSASGRNGSTGSDFASQLSRRLQGDAGAEIVRHAQMVVRGKESGEMRLVLRPDNLGSVRVRMQMEDGLITVRFLVENNGVRQALEQSLTGLQQAFEDAGLQTGSLDVSVGNGGNSDAEEQGQGDSTRRDLHRLAAAVPGISEFGFSEHAVDLIA